VRDARAFGSTCVQTAPETGAAAGGSEDCLTLNVWRPAGAPPPGGWPVMVFLHGGYNLRGSSGYEIEPGRVAYDGKALAARGVVFVSINYRLGALGWMAHGALAAERGNGATGNYGAHDQIAALSWLQRNVGVFGGDPARVLLFGQSAGATDGCVLVASPLAKGLFSRVIMHSGVCAALPRARALEAGDEVADRLGCTAAADVLACMRAKPAASVAAAVASSFTAGGFSWNPIVDGELLPESPAALLAAGAHNRMPMVLGVTAHETTTLWRSAYPSVPVPATAADHEAAMQSIYGPSLGRYVAAQYPAASYPSPAFASVAATSDASFVCPAREAARVVAVAQGEPVRRFLFAHVLASGPARSLGAGHGFDLLFTFAMHPLSFFTPTPSELALEDAMIGYWTRFAATGDPNGAGAPAWPPYDPAADTHLVLDDTITLGRGLRAAQCDFWTAVRGTT